MLELRNNDRVIVQLNPDGSVVYGAEYSAVDAARTWWALMGPIIASTTVNYTENGVEQVSVSLDGKTLGFKGDYVPTPEALAFWQAVRAVAPFRTPAAS